MDGFRLLHRLRLTNILSYGPKAEPIDLEPLNVLIGPNGSGKSNLIEAISLLRAVPGDLAAPIRTGGGFSEWLWKGSETAHPRLRIETSVALSKRKQARYVLELARVGHVFEISEETIEPTAAPLAAKSASASGIADCYRYRDGNWTLWSRTGTHESTESASSEATKSNAPRGANRSTTVFSQIKDIERYPTITLLGSHLSEIQFFRSIDIGRDSKLRGPHRADEPASFLLEDGRNLGVVLSDLLNRPPTKKQILKELQRFYSPVEDITTKVYANTVETSFHERGLTRPIPSIRLSDGTLRYLALLTILCHPEPPPLVCIEDPEVGLHPDILPRLADLLIEASQRMQLIVTTHSDILVSALSHVPEAVVVCERDDEGTHLRRLDPAHLEEWLKKYSLGDLWSAGELGGNP